mgnify:CR=1 FL=1
MKITFIGAGSLTFTRNLLSYILKLPAFREDLTICLEDIDEHRLSLIQQYMKKYVADNADVLKNVQIEATTNQRKAIEGARYVICAIQVGGLDAYKIDMEIHLKYNIHQVVGDSLGPGGVFRFLRSVPVYESILKDINEVGEVGKNGSKPLFLNYTNPMAMNTWYCNKFLPDSTVGLCHGVQGTADMLRKWIGAFQAGEFSFFCAGINHMAWFLKLLYRDPEKDPNLTGPWNDAYPIIWEHFNDEPQMMGEEKVRIDMMKATGYFMTESSGHLAEYLPYYLKRKDLIEKYRSDLKTGFETLEQSYYFNSCSKRDDDMDDMYNKAFEQQHQALKKIPSSEYCSHILNALETGSPFVFNANVINKGQGLITNLPRDCCVEVPITADFLGLHPQGGIELPPICQGLCMSNIMVQQAAVQGAFQRRKDLIYHAVMLDPNTASVCSPEEIRVMVDEMISAQKQWIPKLD